MSISNLEKKIDFHQEQIKKLQAKISQIKFNCQHQWGDYFYDPPACQEDPPEGDVERICLKCGAVHLCFFPLIGGQRTRCDCGDKQ